MNGKWGFSIKRSKKAQYVCLSKDGSCDFAGADYSYIDTFLPPGYNCLSEGVYSFDREFDLESKLLAAGFEKDEYRAKTVLDYMKEHGSLRS